MLAATCRHLGWAETFEGGGGNRMCLMDAAMDDGKATARQRRQKWTLTAAVAGRDGGRWRLTATMDDGDGAVVEN